MDAFETELFLLVEKYGWEERVRAGIRKQRVALASHPADTAKALGDRFGLSRAAVDELVSMAPRAGGLSAPIAAPATPRTVWEKDAEPDAQPAVRRAPARPVNTTVGPGMIAPGLALTPVDTEGRSWSSFCRRKPEANEVVATFVSLAGQVAADHLRGRYGRCLDADHITVDDGRVALCEEDHEPRAAYRSPEHVRDEARTAASDVFVLGTLLFEALSGVSWFNRVGVDATHAAILAGDRRPHERAVPDALVAACTRATRKTASRRPADAVVFLQEVVEASRPHDGSEAPAVDWSKLVALRTRAEAANAESRRLEALELTRQADAIERSNERVEAAWRASMEERLLAGEADVRTPLAAALRDAHRRAVRRGEERPDLLDTLDRVDVDGRHQTYRTGAGRLTIVTEPAGVEADLYRYDDREGRLWPVQERSLGATPISNLEVAMGSYVVILRGETEVRYPVRIDRRTHWHGTSPNAEAPAVLRIPGRGQLGPEDVLVSPGWFKVGRSKRWTWADGFVMRRTPIRTREYVEFLTALKRAGDEAQLARCGLSAGPGIVWEGTTPRLQPDAGGRSWSSEWPAIGVPRAGAVAYAKWRGSLDGHPWRLPTELEWEKAARGVDGRLHPWGDQADTSFTRCGASTPVGVEDTPADSSPYGIRGLGGNVSDWVDAPAAEGFGVAKGGSYASRLDGLSAPGAHVVPLAGSVLVGFRLVRDA